MSARILSSQLPEQAGKPVRMQGWVHRIRNFGGVRFLVLRDRGGLAQVVVPPALDLANVGCETVVEVRGEVRAEPRAPGGFEVLAQRVATLSVAEPPPIDIFGRKILEETRLDTLLDHRAVSLRIPQALDIFRVQAAILRGFRESLTAEGFTEIATPKLVLAGAEGGAALFEVEYFERKAYLAQSPQFYKQIMVGSGLERVFEVGHAYRAEKSETSRHLTEFVSLDLEMGFIQSEQDIMDVLTRVVSGIVETVRAQCGPILSRQGINLPPIERIPQISFPDARRILAERFGKTDGVAGDLDTEGERLIGQYAAEEWRSPLVFVTGYALSCRPAYTMPSTADPALSASFDLLWNGVEIATGGQRIHQHEQLASSFRARGLDPANYADYFEAFRHGMPPHGGMGMGLERLTKQMMNLKNVKQACLFPRDRNRLSP